MKYIGKREDFYFYRVEGKLELLYYLPEIKPDHIIAGGSAIATVMNTGGYKDIDVWVSGEIPEEATRESEYAFNYQKNNYCPQVQYMKVRATTPSALLSVFDLDACKCVLYNITGYGYNVCLHKYLKPLVYGGIPSGICSVNANSYNRFSLYRMNKYANKFGRNISDMFLLEDYAKALQHSEFSHIDMQSILEGLATYTDSNQYELIDHLRDLFTADTTRISIGSAGVNMAMDVGAVPHQILQGYGLT